MSQIKYTNPGEFLKQIDFYDPGIPGQNLDPNDGSELPPQLVAQGVNCKLEALWSNTEARRLGQQVVSEITHRITLRYQAGIFSRMFVIYHDIDNGDRKFTIEMVSDPDEMKVELRMLCIERN